MVNIRISEKVKKILDSYKKEFESKSYSDTIQILHLKHQLLKKEVSLKSKNDVKVKKS